MAQAYVDENLVTVERLHIDLARDEPLGADFLPDDPFAIRGAGRALTRNHDAFAQLPTLDDDVHGRARAEARAVLNLEIEGIELATHIRAVADVLEFV